VLGMKHLASSDFVWRRLFELLVPFTAKLTVFFPHGKLHVLNAASPISARKTRLFVPIYRNFDKDASLQDTLDFNDQVMLRGMKIALTPQPPLPERRGGAKSRKLLSHSLFGRGARGEGLRNFHVTSVIRCFMRTRRSLRSNSRKICLFVSLMR
jgi:hypothetical protein